MLKFKQLYQILNEGGAGGHMDHPFEVPTVNNGADLVDLFNKTVSYLETSPAILKVDGSNISVKLVTSGTPQFGIDRGSSMQLDKDGVIISKLQDRFPNNPNLAKKGKIVLEIFNRSLPKIQNEIKLLGLKDSERFINMEYIEGKSNVIEYEGNFLVLHNIGEFYTAISSIRGTKSRKTESVTFNEAALYSLVEKLQPAAIEVSKEYNISPPFTIYHKILGTLTKKPNFNNILSTPLSLNLGSLGDIQTKPLETWLKEVINNPEDKKVSFLDGTEKKALNKERLYIPAIKGTPLTTFLKEDKVNIKKAVDGIVLYHATRLLGNEILKHLEFPEGFGPGEKQEGIVINSATVAPVPFKITGEFIVTGLQSPFKKQPTLQETVVFVYGRFNPPTEGHVALIENLVKLGKQNNAKLIAVVPSHSYNAKTDPLSFPLKFKALQIITESIDPNIEVLQEGKTFIGLLKYFTENKFTKAIQLAGSDRIAGYESLIEKYNGKRDSNGNIVFNIPSYEVVNAGERDPDSEGTSGISATKVRQAAKLGTLDQFKNSGIAKSIPEDVLKDIYNAIRGTI
jgi:cytidyltransferase-like protein